MIRIRPVGKADAEGFRSFLRRLSPGSRSNRFLAPVRDLSPDLLAQLVDADQARHVALVATEDDEIVAEGRYVALDDGQRGEFAIAVADDWQRQGLGARLLGTLVAAARRAGLRTLYGEILKSNTAMLRFMQRAGFTLRDEPGDAAIAIAERRLA
jgi:acetyltransferase